MFARKPDNAGPAPISREIVSDLAAAVGKGAQLQMAEGNLTNLRARRDDLKAEQGRLIHDAHSGPQGGTWGQGDRIREFDRDISALEQQIKSARPKVSELRRARAGRVNDALISIQRESAARIVAAYEELTAATEILIACNDEVRKAGDPDRPHLNHMAGVSLIAHARWLLK